MAFSIRIPGILRLVFVQAADEIYAANDATAVQRSLSGRGGLVNRFAAAKLRVFRTSDGDIWPAFRDRLDPRRAEYQRELEEALADVPALLRRIAPEILRLADFVRGQAAGEPGLVIQQAMGRLFFSDYTATKESYSAAQTLWAWLSAGPLKSFRLKRSGALQAALDKITELARGNTACAHATGIAMENMAKSVALMRELARAGNNLDQIDPRDAAARTLRAPERVLREARDGLRIGNLHLTARSLVVFGVEAARRQSPDPGFGFFTNAWNRCPAHALVPALLGEIWRVAKNEP